MVDGNLKVDHYKNETIIKKPVCIGVDVINTISIHNRDLISTPLIPKNNVSPWSDKSVF